MNITISVDDLTTFIDGFNNAMLAYKDVRDTAYLTPENLSLKWDKVVGEGSEKSVELIDKRLYALKKVYTQLLKYEEENN